jgi:hypothetical protein
MISIIATFKPTSDETKIKEIKSEIAHLIELKGTTCWDIVKDETQIIGMRISLHSYELKEIMKIYKTIQNTKINEVSLEIVQHGAFNEENTSSKDIESFIIKVSKMRQVIDAMIITISDFNINDFDKHFKTFENTSKSILNQVI